MTRIPRIELVFRNSARSSPRYAEGNIPRRRGYARAFLSAKMKLLRPLSLAKFFNFTPAIGHAFFVFDLHQLVDSLVDLLLVLVAYGDPGFLKNVFHKAKIARYAVSSWNSISPNGLIQLGSNPMMRATSTFQGLCYKIAHQRIFPLWVPEASSTRPSRAAR